MILLALDAGGTSTRAVLIDADGQALGYGRAGGGNPTSAGLIDAAEALAAASGQALAGGPGRGTPVTIAMAGQQLPAYVELVGTRLAELGCGPVSLQPDLLGVFHSGTPLLDGYALIAGTGTVSARVVEGRLERVAGGNGWLLGDAGSGYWIGHQVARAVIAALDDEGPSTALTPLVLAAVGLAAGPEMLGGRPRVVRELVTTLYTWRPVQLASFAPLAFRVPSDPVARGILIEAAAALGELLAAVRMPELPGPVVVGGSVVMHGWFTAPPDLRALVLPGADALLPVPDGLTGAAVLALRGAGVSVDEPLFTRLRSEIHRIRQPPAPEPFEGAGPYVP